MDAILDAYCRCSPLSDKQMQALERKGVHPDVLGFDKEAGHHQIRAASVTTVGALWFDVGGVGKVERRAIIICKGEDGQIADLAAWSPADNSVRLMLGAVSMIGEEACSRPRLAGDKLWVRESVLDWLIHRRTGIVIMDPEKARPVLTACGPLAVMSRAHKARLDAMWAPPSIRVFNDGLAASVTEAA